MFQLMNDLAFHLGTRACIDLFNQLRTHAGYWFLCLLTSVSRRLCYRICGFYWGKSRESNKLRKLTKFSGSSLVCFTHGTVLKLTLKIVSFSGFVFHSYCIWPKTTFNWAYIYSIVQFIDSLLYPQRMLCVLDIANVYSHIV